MLEFKNELLMFFVNLLLFPWLITQWLPGLIILAVFHNCEWYVNKDAGIRVIKVNKGYFIGDACFSCGPIIFVTPNCDENIIKHETGHSKQSLIFGWFFHIVVSFPSVIRFWIRRLFNKSHEWYLSGWPESSAEKLGHTNRQ
jgi:hypothetical protein